MSNQAARSRQLRTTTRQRTARIGFEYRQTLGFMVDVLDDGLRLYRRHFWRYVGLAAVALAPLALGARLVIWLGRSSTAEWVWAVLAAWPLASLLLGVYWVGSLSRATVTALSGKPFALRGALAIEPRRALRGGAWAVLRGLGAFFYCVIVAVAAMAAWGAVLFVIGACLRIALSVSGVARAVTDALLALMFWLGGFGLLVIIGGMPLASIAFGLQPWFQDERPAAAPLKRSTQVWRDGDAEGMYFVAALAVLCLGAVITLSLSVLFALPFQNLSAPFLTRGTLSLLVAAILVLPLLPIWMALLYRKLSADVDGGELGSRIASWRSSIGVS